MYSKQLIVHFFLISCALFRSLVQAENLRGSLEATNQVDQRRLSSIWSKVYYHLHRHPHHSHKSGGSGSGSGSSGNYTDDNSSNGVDDDTLSTLAVDDAIAVSNDLNFDGNGTGTGTDTGDGSFASQIRSSNSIIAFVTVGAAVGAVVAAVTLSRKRNVVTAGDHPLSGSVPKRKKTFATVMKHLSFTPEQDDFRSSSENGIQSDYVRV